MCAYKVSETSSPAQGSFVEVNGNEFAIDYTVGNESLNLLNLFERHQLYMNETRIINWKLYGHCTTLSEDDGAILRALIKYCC